MRSDKDYEIGYGRPPKDTRFKPGTSGNPKGRPRALKNLSTVFDAVLNERVTVVENGKRKTLRLFDTIVKKVAIKAAAGDQAALRLVLQTWFRLHPDGNQPPDPLDLVRRLAAAAAIEIKKEKARACPIENSDGILPALGSQLDSGFDQR